MLLQRRLHDAALHAGAAAVNQPDFAQPCLVRRAHVFLDDRRDVARLEGVEIQEASIGIRMSATPCRRRSLPSTSAFCLPYFAVTRRGRSRRAR